MKSQDEEMDVEVLAEDQQDINKFSKLNMRGREVESSITQLKVCVGDSRGDRLSLCQFKPFELSCSGVYQDVVGRFRRSNDFYGL